MIGGAVPDHPKKLILTVIDGLGPELLDQANAAGLVPTIAYFRTAIGID